MFMHEHDPPSILIINSMRNLQCAVALLLNGCSNPLTGTRSTNIPSSLATSTTTRQPSESTFTPHWTVTAVNSSSNCKGHSFGTYSWDSSYYRLGNPDLLNFLESPIGKEYACGDVYINIADYSSADNIPDPGRLSAFIKEFRTRIGNWDAVVFLTYGDVTSRDGAAMLEFTQTF